MNTTTRAVVVVFGILAALVGIEHGVGALVQGNVAPPATVYSAWPEAPSFDVLAGEPALTFIPNLFGSGVSTILVAAALIMWLSVSVHRKWGPLGLLVLSVTLLAVGGGFGPPITLLVVCLAATRIRHRLSWWRKRSAGFRKRLARFWPWATALSLAGYLFLFPGLVLLSAYAGFDREYSVLAAAAVALVFLALAIVSAGARDSLSALPQESDDEAS